MYSAVERKRVVSKALVYAAGGALGLACVIRVAALGAREMDRKGKGTEPPAKVHVLLHEKSKARVLDSSAPHFARILRECEQLLKTSDNTYKLIVTEELIANAKRESAIEVVYPHVESTVLPFNRQTLYYTALYVPLHGRFANGTVFYRGMYARFLGSTKPTYPTLAKSYGAVINDSGLDRLRVHLKKL
jgi:hypothetical protein